MGFLLRAFMLSLTFLALGKGASYFDETPKQLVQEELVADVVEEEAGAPEVAKAEEEQSLEWLTTQQEASEFDFSDDIYKGPEVQEVVQAEFDKVDHQALFATYFESTEELRKQVSPAPAPTVIAKEVNELRKPATAVIAEDVVSEKMAKNLNILKEEHGPPLVFDYSGEEKMASSEPARKKRELMGEALQREILQKLNGVTVKEAGNSSVNVTVQAFSFERGPGKGVRNFEIRPDYSELERWSDRGSGRLSIQKEINSQMGVIGSLLRKQGAVDTRIDLSFEKNVIRELSIPVFSQDEFISFLSKREVSGEGGHLFIELDDSTESAGLDTEYEKSFYLDGNLRVVGASDDYRYLLFVGIPPGSTTIEYIRNGYENLKKVILIEEGAIYYELNEYVEVNEDIVEIKQANVLSSNKSDINIGGQEIAQFNSFETVSQIGPDRYDMTIGSIPSGTRKYVEFNHLSAPIYLGRWGANKLTVPSESYISFFLNTMEIEDLTGLCLVQINFKSKVRKLNIEGKDGMDYLPIDRIYMDGEGQFSEELSPLAVQGFILSDRTGVLSIEVKYEDGTGDYLNSYCSDSTYLIEQL